MFGTRGFAMKCSIRDHPKSQTSNRNGAGAFDARCSEIAEFTLRVLNREPSMSRRKFAVVFSSPCAVALYLKAEIGNLCYGVLDDSLGKR